MKMLHLSGLSRTGLPAISLAGTRPGRLFATLLFLMYCIELSAQQPVAVHPVLTPPFSPYLEDYLDQAVITLTNQSANVLQLKLVGNIESDDGIYVRTSDNWHPPVPIVLQPFQTRTFFANSRSDNFLDPQNVETNVDDAQQTAIARTGILPEGNYTFCVKAVDYLSGADLSAPQPQGCIPVIISYPEPPVLTFPLCGTDVTATLPSFSWIPPVGNLTGAAIRYDFFLVKLLPGQDPNDAMQLAVNYNAGNPLKIQNLLTTTYNYKPYDPPLQENATYAWTVIARDINHKVIIQNGGQSEVCTFIWKKPGKVFNSDDPSLVNNNNSVPDDGGEANANNNAPGSLCPADCSFDLSNPGTFWQNPVVGPDDILKMGDFNMEIVSIDPNPMYPGTLSGMGLIPVPFLNSSNVRVRVRFDSIVINTDKQVLGGRADAMVNPDGPGFIPQYNDTGWDGFTMGNGSDPLGFAEMIYDQVQAAKNHLLTAYETYGWEVPLGYEMDGHTLAITRIRWRPTFAQFDALAVVNLPNYTGSVSALQLGAGKICFSSDDMCAQGKLFLASDFEVDLMQQPGKELKILHSDINSNNGTYLVFNKDGIDSLRLEADYFLPTDVVTRADGGPGPVKLHFAASMDSLSDWLFSAHITPFYIAGSQDFKFLSDTVWIDLSDVSNPPTLGAGASPADSAYYAAPDWMGLYIPTIGTEFKNPLNEDPLNPTTFGVQNLYIDSSGVSAHIYARNIIDLTTGEVETFNFSVDTLDVVLSHNSFLNAKLSGGMLFNIAGRTSDQNGIIVVDAQTKQNMLVYHCLLSHQDPNPNDNDPNKKFIYEFAMHPKDGIVAPIWFFTLGLDNTSHLLVSNASGSLHAECMLNGVFGVDVNIPAVGMTEFVGLQFQNLGLLSESPYFQMGQFSLANGAPGGDNFQQKGAQQNNAVGNQSDADGDDGGGQNSLSDFPLNINDISFVTDGHGHFGVQFDIALKLSEMNAMLPDASSKFTIYGTLFDQAGHVNPGFAHADLNEICIDANLSVVHISGCVTIFNDDAVFGNGFKGNLKVGIPGMADISATLQIGRVNAFDYWYFDAMVILENTGIPLFAGLEAFGFGGGAYYHMQRQQDTIVYDLNTSQNYDPPTGSGAPPPTIGQSNSGVTYVPNAQIGFGLKAMIYFGSMGQRDVFNGDVGLEVSIDSDGGLDEIKLTGRARYISNEEMSDGVVTGWIVASYSHSQKVFSLDVGAKLDFDIVEANALLSVYIDGKPDPVGFYVKFGRPLQGQFANVTLFDAYTMETYFEFGNLNIDPMPGPQPFIADLVGPDFAKSASERSGLDSGSEFSIIHGARSTIGYKGEFLAFYASFEAGFGYDLELRKVTKGCGGVPANEVGIDGWYASGQIYIGAKGEMGMHVDIGVYKGDFSIMEIGLAAKMDGGFMNPTWLDGIIVADYNLFDGAITGHVDYEFSVGQKCIVPDPDPLESIQLITDIHPADGVKTVDVTAVLAAGTFLKMDAANQIHMKQKMADNTTKHHLFRFSPKMVHAELSHNGLKDSLELPLISDDRYGLSWTPKTTLNKETDFTLKITAQLEACDAVQYDDDTKTAKCVGSWDIAQYNGADWKEDHVVKFKTNEGLEKIPEELVEYTTPYQLSSHFVWKDKVKPKIKMSQGFNPNSYKLGPAGSTVTYKARFIPMNNNANSTVVPVALNLGDTTINMNWPGSIQPNTYYSLQFLATWEAVQNLNNNQNNAIYDPNNPSNGGGFTTRQVDKEYFHAGYKYATVYKTKLAADKLIIPKNTALLYEIRYRSSQHQNLDDKLEPMVPGEADYVVADGQQWNGTNDYKNVVVLGKDMDTPAEIVAAINKKLGRPQNSVPEIRFMDYIKMRGEERFDRYDIQGYIKLMPGGKEIKRAPYLRYTSNSSLHNFHLDWQEKLLKTLYDKDLADVDLSGLLDRFNYYFTAPQDELIGWDDGLNAPNSGDFAGNMQPGGNFMFYQPGGGITNIDLNGTGGIRNYHDWIRNDGYEVPFDFDHPLYDNRKWVLTYHMDYNGRWQPPAEVDPFEWVGDLWEVDNWNLVPVNISYTEFLHRLGVVFDMTDIHWGTLGDYGIGNPVISGPNGPLNPPIRPGIFNLTGSNRSGGRK